MLKGKRLVQIANNHPTQLSQSIYFILIALLIGCAEIAFGDPLSVVIDPQSNSISLGSYTEYWIDYQAESDIQKVRNLPNDNWIPSNQDVPSMGFSPEVYWFRIALTNPSHNSLLRLLSANYTSIDNMVFYVFSEGELKDRYETGDRFPFSTRRVYNRNFILPIEFAPKTSNQIYIRVQTEGIVQLPILLRSPENYNQFEQHILMIQGLYYGVALIMVLYNLVLFASVKDTTYLFFVLGIGAYAIFQASIQGFAFQYLWPDHPAFNQKAVI